MNLRRTAGHDPWSSGGSIQMVDPRTLDLGSVRDIGILDNNPSLLVKSSISEGVRLYKLDPGISCRR